MITGRMWAADLGSVTSILEEASWGAIRAVGSAGTGSTYWDIGDRKSIVLNGNMGILSLSNITLDVYIIHFNYRNDNGIYFQCFKQHSDGKDLALCDGTWSGDGSSSTDGTKRFNMNHWGSYNYGGWKGCDVRYDILGSTNVAPSGYGNAASNGRVGYDATASIKTSPVSNTLMAALPSNLRSVLAPWTIYTDNTGNSSNVLANVTTSIDYLPLLASYEIIGTSDSSYANQYESTLQVQMSYYANSGSKVKYNHSAVSNTVRWWTRSAYRGNNDYFINTNTGGNRDYVWTRYSDGLSPAFRVA